MEQHHRQRARRRAQTHTAPLTDERFRVVVDEGERSTRNPVSGITTVDAVKFGNFDSIQPYVGSATVCSNDVAPPTPPSHASSGIQLRQPIPIGAEAIAPPSEAPPAKAPEEVRLRGLVLLVAGSIVATGVGLFVAFTMLIPKAPVDAPALPAAMGVSVEAKGANVEERAAPVAPPEQPAQQAEEDDGSFVILDEPSPSPRTWPARASKQATSQPQQPADTSTTSSKAGRRSPVIF